MNKGQLIDVLAEKCEITKISAANVLDTLIAEITKTLQGGEKVAISGFGSFESRHRKARMGINPSTGEKLKIPATKVPAFKAGKSFKMAIKGH